MSLKTLICLLCALLWCSVCSAADDVRKPVLDKDGRFYVYKNGKANLPYVPYGWMPEEGSKMLTVDMECKEKPYIDPDKKVEKPDKDAKPEVETCVSVKVTWMNPYWCGIAWISGPTGAPGDDKAWWGEDDRGWFYSLEGLKKKRLVVYARGQRGGERIQIKCGILGDKPHGDSLPFPAESKPSWLKLGTSFARYEIDLSHYKPEELRKVCSGFVVVSSQAQQEGDNKTSMQFYLDNIYLE